MTVKKGRNDLDQRVAGCDIFDGIAELIYLVMNKMQNSPRYAQSRSNFASALIRWEKASRGESS